MHRSLVVLACAGLLLAGCGDAGENGFVQQRDRLASPAAPDAGGPSGSAEAPRPRQEDVAALVERALVARDNDSEEFAELVAAAGKVCPDPGAARRLGDVAAIASRWSSALLDGRPKAQAVTEAQLAKVDWDALVAACVAS